MIDLQTLTISYGKKVLVDSVNAEFAPGTVYGLVAPNGHGKTTLLRAMANRQHPRFQNVEICNVLPVRGSF